MLRRTVMVGGGVAAVGAAAAALLLQSRSDADYLAAAEAQRRGLADHPDFTELVRFATLAANSHNTQAWTFRQADRRIDILPDLSRRTPVVDPDDHHLFVSLGCAGENLSLAAAARGLPGTVSFNPGDGGSLQFDYRSGPAATSPLFDAIPRRQSTRSEYDGRAASDSDLAQLIDLPMEPGVRRVVLTSRREMEKIADVIAGANALQGADKAYLAELKSWLRYNAHSAASAGDGLYSAASGAPSLPDWLGPTLFDWFHDLRAEGDKIRRQIMSSAGLVVFAGERADRDHWTRVGRSCQRFALQLTALGLKHAFTNQPVEIAAARPELAAAVGLPDLRPDIVMRFGNGADMPYSLRRPVDAVVR